MCILKIISQITVNMFQAWFTYQKLSTNKVWSVITNFTYKENNFKYQLNI